ncbi:MAG: polymer-forming cytoskeletal protein [Kiloniellaceae bacterium]
MFNRRRPPKPEPRREEPAPERTADVLRTPPIKPFKRPADAPPPASAQIAAPVAAPAAPPRVTPPVARPAYARTEQKKLGRLLLVGRDIRLAGEIKTCERLVVEGAIEGDLSDTRSLEIAETGRFRGTAVVETCVVGGAFDGELTVRGVLALRPTARVTGTIRYGEIEIERGGRIAGDFDMHGAPETPTALRPAPEAAPRSANGRPPAAGPERASEPGPRPA